jgi:hypothetical protein
VEVETVELVVRDDPIVELVTGDETTTDEDEETGLDEDELDCPAPFLLYTLRRLPAPHSWYLLPEHRKLQSDAGAATLPVPKVFPQ